MKNLHARAGMSKTHVHILAFYTRFHLEFASNIRTCQGLNCKLNKLLEIKPELIVFTSLEQTLQKLQFFL